MALDIHPWMRSPQCEVHWAGFVGNTTRMQRNGWEFATEHHWHGDHPPMLVFRHRGAGWMGMARCANPHSLIMASSLDGRYHSDNEPPIFEAAVMKTDDKIVFAPAIRTDWSKFERIDMEPEIEMAARFHPRQIFRPWKEPQEIIVAPESVHELLERIKKMQSPELAEVRARNRRRELVDQVEAVPEIACATILQYGT